MDPFGIRALEQTRRHVLSARPDAPVVPEHRPDGPPLADLRVSVAALLRYLADRVEPERDIETRPL
ncbi:hypothetical protein ACFY2R_08035 [Micromonospora olivasterospora]|uniref:Uncharacterized protein n=1 Tax=Micromonospora olivasterospora TaxID=1880 RepID=A0A562I4Y2_MICOL|nr:hypothetical protein [Micromonospora olivasterospora]TWH65693.1 hypothetical protein JD77_00631 [Micromonospora olivasterospora]